MLTIPLRYAVDIHQARFPDEIPEGKCRSGA